MRARLILLGWKVRFIGLNPDLVRGRYAAGGSASYSGVERLFRAGPDERAARLRGPHSSVNRRLHELDYLARKAMIVRLAGHDKPG